MDENYRESVMDAYTTIPPSYPGNPNRYYIQEDGVWKPVDIYTNFVTDTEPISVGSPTSTYMIRAGASSEPSIPVDRLETKLAELRAEKDTLSEYAANVLEKILEEWRNGEE